jgi:hypothetical protein
MRKFKLIKEYPNSVPLGTIVDKEWDEYGVQFGRYPEYWEELVQKDYEILSFRASTGLLRIKDYDGLFQANGDVRRDNTTEQYLLKEGWNIYSVKRLSDGEVFCLGDICFPTSTPSNKLPISEIWFTQSGDLRLSSDNYTMSIGGLTKYEEPKVLFTTTDGVNIFKNQPYYGVYTKTFQLEYLEEGIDYELSNDDFDETYITFSTKEKAQEYILMNKPVLSLNDLLDNWSITVVDRATFESSPMFRTFRHVAENKIKNL